MSQEVKESHKVSIEAEINEHGEEVHEHEEDVKAKTIKTESGVGYWKFVKGEQETESITMKSGSRVSDGSSSSSRIKVKQMKAELQAQNAALERKFELAMERVKIDIEEERLNLKTKLAIAQEREKIFKEELIDDEDDDDDSSSVSSYYPTRNHHDNKNNHYRDNSDVISQMVRQMRKPTPDICAFDGNPLKFRKFTRQFKSKIENNCDSYDEKMNYLEQYTVGAAHDIVSGYSVLDSKVGFKSAMRALEDRYGNDELIVNSFVDKAKNWKPIRSDDAVSLDKFSIFLTECENAVQSIPAVQILENADHLQQFASKLPYGYQERWRGVVEGLRDKRRTVKFKDFAEFVRKEARKASDPIFGKEAMKLSQGQVTKYPKKQDTRSPLYKSTVATDVTDVKVPDVKQQQSKRFCIYCTSPTHNTEKCFKFQDLTVDQRLQFLKSKRLCFKCMSPGHMSGDCVANIHCNICNGKHQTLLHSDTGVQTSRREDYTSSRNQVSSVCTDHEEDCLCCAAKERTEGCTLAIIPVKVRCKNSLKVIETYAFLDPGSSASFCTDELRRQLGVEGRKRKLTIETMSSTHTLITNELSNIEVFDLKMKQAVNIPRIYTKERLPVSASHIPTNEDISKWAHLKEIDLPKIKASIGLLIGNNIPDAYSPIKVITGPRGSPHAIHSLLGWIVWNVLRDHERSPIGTVRESVNRIDVHAIEETQQTKNFEEMNKKSQCIDFPEADTEEDEVLSRKDEQFEIKVQESVLTMCANTALLQTVEDIKNSTTDEVISVVEKSFHVDDCPKNSLETEDKVIDMIQDVSTSCQKGGIHLSKCVSNSHKVMDSIVPEERVKGLQMLDLENNSQPTEKAVSMYWQVERDTLGCKAVLKNRFPTRRGILSVVSSVFDPIGLLSPFVLKAKILLQGPQFLWKDESCWPKFPDEQCNIEVDPEVKKVVKFVNVDESEHMTCIMERLINHYSSWSKLKRAVGWILLTVQVLREKTSSKKAGPPNEKVLRPQLTTEVIGRSESLIIKYIQGKHFSEELDRLNKVNSDVNSVKRSSPLFKLDPILKDGLIRVGGRLSKAEMTFNMFNQKHQVILPRNSPVSKIILHEAHKAVGHMGKNSMLSYVRKFFWIIGAGKIIKSITSKCVTCLKYKAPAMEQKMADLPQERLKSYQPPFSYVGMDFFGPFYVKRARSTVKRYGVVFTCMSIQAIHLEVASSLDTDSCLNAVRRFIARRGVPKVIRSDNGTNLVGCAKELHESLQDLNQSKKHSSLLLKGIDWRFNVPGASHQGGVWERMIRTVRQVLYSILKEQPIKFVDEGLHSLMCEVESIINNRPITEVSSCVNDLSPLTPNHLLLLRSGESFPPGTFNKDDLYSHRRWRQIQYLADIFWRRWKSEYLPLLQTRQRWNNSKRNLRPDDIVLLMDNSPRNSWSLGRVIRVAKDKKGYVRSVHVKSATTELDRPVAKLVLLVCSEDNT